MTRYQPGGTVTATVENTVGAIVTGPLTIRYVDKLGCGCTRITCHRPGPPGDCPTVQLLTGCGWHTNDLHPALTSGTPERSTL